MAENDPKQPVTTQISTTDLHAPPPTEPPTATDLYPGATPEATGADPNSGAQPSAAQGPDAGEVPYLYQGEGPAPAGTYEGAVSDGEGDHNPAVDSKQEAGIEGELIVWEARYSARNFLGRFLVRVVLTVGWIMLAAYTWGRENAPPSPGLKIVTILSGIFLGVLWLQFLYRFFMARYGHYYRLTTRRLFVSTGVFDRRRDQVELLRINDVYTRQGFLERWLSIGTVVVESSEERYPMTYIVGVDDPKAVMDLIWHHSRAEREQKTVKVDQV